MLRLSRNKQNLRKDMRIEDTLHQQVNKELWVDDANVKERVGGCKWAIIENRRHTKHSRRLVRLIQISGKGPEISGIALIH